GTASAAAHPLLEHYARQPTVRIPQGECLDDFRRRVLPALTRLLAAAARSGETIAVVTHSRNLSVAQDWLAAGRDAARMGSAHLRADRVKPAAIMVIAASE